MRSITGALWRALASAVLLVGVSAPARADLAPLTNPQQIFSGPGTQFSVSVAFDEVTQVYLVVWGTFNPQPTLGIFLNAQGALLIGLGVATALRPRAWLALAQLAVSLWVYAGLAPVVGDLAAHGFANARIWLQPLPLAAFAFFPLAFFGWRALARETRSTLR